MIKFAGPRADTVRDDGGSGVEGGMSMSVPPPPPTGPPAGGFFGGPVPPPVAQYGYAAPAPVFGAYAPPATFGAPPVVGRAPAGPRTPELVTAACTLLGVFAAIGAFTVLAVLMLNSGSSSSADGSGASLTDIGIGSIYGLLWGGSGFINVALIVYLRRGNATARLLTSVICGLWTLYWLRVLFEAANVDTSASLLGGTFLHLAELLLLGLAIASALPAAVLWRSEVRDHFA